MNNAALIQVSPEDRDEITEVLQEYVNDLFDAFDDGRITMDEFRTATVKAIAGSAKLVIPDQVEEGVLPFLRSALGSAWEELDGAFRDEDRLRRRIAEATAEGKTRKAARLQEILDGLLED